MRSVTLYSLIFVCLLLSVGFFSCKGEAPEETAADLVKVDDIQTRLQQFVPTELSFDEALLNPEQIQVVEKLVAAAKHIDRIFWKQASAQGLAIRKQLEASESPEDQDFLKYLKINYGAYDRLDENKPFIGTDAKPAGAAFYPPDMTKAEFSQNLTDHPDTQAAFESPYTLIQRTEEGLKAIPYNQYFLEDLTPAAELLKEAAAITTNASLKKYLNQKADDLLSNDYYQSDCDWIDLKDNLVEIVIGPYEVYEDGLMGLKAAYESFVYVNDIEEMNKIQGYINYLDEMQKNLPVEQKYKDQKVAGLQSPLNVVYEVFNAGDGRAGVQTIAFILPNDERVREEKGSKKVMLKNMMEAKFNKILTPIAQKTLFADDANNISFYAFFNQTILHELCHALGVNYTTAADGTRVTVNRALKEHYSAIEEAKADVLGLYSVRLLIAKGWIPPEKESEIYTTYLAGIFRSLRFGLHEAHGLGTLLQYNFMREKEAFVYDESSGKFRLDRDKIADAVKDLAAALLILEGDGDYDKAGAFLTKYGQVEDILEKTIAGLAEIPVDIKPIFKYD